MSDDKKHAALAPSAGDRWMVCPGSVVLTKGLPDTSSVHSLEGTDYHELGAQCLERGDSALDYVGQPLLSGAIVDQDNAKFLQEGYIEVIRTYAVDGSLLIEEECPLSTYTLEPNANGTSDAVIIKQDRELIIADLKFGRGVEVSPDDNRQCKLYALGVIEKHQLHEEVDTIRLVICQPRAGSGKPQEWVISMPDLLLFGEEVKRVSRIIWDGVERSKKAGMNVLPLVPTEKGCRWCKAKGTCPALLNVVQTATADGFLDETATIDAGYQSVYDGVKLGKAMDMVDLVEIWMKAVQATVESELLAGRPVIGKDGPYKLVQGKKGNRKWIDEKEAEVLLKSFRFKKEQIYDSYLISPTDADKLLAKEFPQRWEKVKPLFNQSEGAKHVANAKDKQQALVLEDPTAGFVDETAVEDFSDLL